MTGKFVAVFRCQSKERRISLTLRTNEGEHGSLFVTIVAESSPKAAKIVKYDLKPLSLHTKLHELSPAELARPRNKMRYSGGLHYTALLCSACLPLHACMHTTYTLCWYQSC